jgi:hypothetical protein
LRGLVALVPVLGLAGGLVWVGSVAASGTTISGPTLVDSAAGIQGLACPSTSQCTAIDYKGREVTFNPTSPGTPTPTAVDNGGEDNTLQTVSPYGNLEGVACPSTSQCTAVDAAGREVTFNPRSPGTPTPTTIDGDDGGAMFLACSSRSECTAVDDTGHEITFNPNSPRTQTRAVIDRGGELYNVVCLSTSRCTAVGTVAGSIRSVALTFDPASPRGSAPIGYYFGENLPGIACPSRSQCTVVHGSERSTFNPTAPGHGRATVTIIDSPSGGALLQIACPSTTKCITLDSEGREVTFNPNAERQVFPTPVDSASRFGAFLACPSASQCTATGGLDTGHEVTFMPTLGKS